MELQHTTQSVGSLETVYDGKLEQAVDGDITLPEYCPDILRILKCGMEPSIHAVQATGERVNVDGSARITVLYAAEDGTLQSFEQSYPFSRGADVGNLNDQCAVTASARAEYANARAVSPRRLDIHGMLTIPLQARRRREDAVLTGVTGGGMQTLSAQVSLSSLEALHAVSFPLSEVIEIEPGAPAVDQIVLRRAAAVATEVKAIKNKLLVKGSLELRVAYRSRGAKEPVQVLHSMPISQIIEAPGVSETTANTLRLRIGSLDAAPKADGSGEARLLEINARVGAEVRAYAPVELPVVQDAYSTQCGVTLESRRLDTRQLLESFRESFSARDSFDIPGKIQGLQLLAGELLPAEIAVKDGAVAAVGRMKANAVYIDGEGKAATIEKELSFSFRRALKKSLPGALAEVELELLSVQGSVSGDTLEVRAELAACGDVFIAETRSVVGSVSYDECEAPPRRSPLTIYFAADGEPLWEIAKRYRTTVDAVRQENELTAESAAAGQMLLIPCV
ncbi:MAG: DUF3794 domain-containing protein [Oscillospiraceae bacterium]|jgi:hypothetical protein|nr:DUF3794 domain-containing protein [Oscillospiraceae bacterium]